MKHFHVNIPAGLFNDKFIRFLSVRATVEILFGGAGSSKTVHSAFKDIISVLNGKNILVVRQVYNTIEDSYYQDLKKAISTLGFDKYFKCKRSPLRIDCANGKVILFRGLDDVEKIKGITVPSGQIDHFTVEEATETREASINQLQFRSRGGGDKAEDSDIAGLKAFANNAKSLEEINSHENRENLFRSLGYESGEAFMASGKTMRLLFNPVDKEHWIAKRFFFDSKGHETFRIEDEVYDTPELYIMHSTHWDNKFLTPEDHLRYESYRFIDPYFYDVYARGYWGILAETIFRNYKLARMSQEFISNIPQVFVGMDFGTIDPNVLMRVGINESKREIYIIDEVVRNKLSTDQLIEMVYQFTEEGETVWSDCAGIQQITDMKAHGIDARPVVKYGQGNFKPHGISCIWGYTIYINETCTNFAREIRNYSWQEDSKGNRINKPQDGNDHTLDAGLFYALNPIWLRKRKTIIH